MVKAVKNVIKPAGSAAVRCARLTAAHQPLWPAQRRFRRYTFPLHLSAFFATKVAPFYDGFADHHLHICVPLGTSAAGSSSMALLQPHAHSFR